VKEKIALAKVKPGEINLGSSGNGATNPSRRLINDVEWIAQQSRRFRLCYAV